MLGRKTGKGFYLYPKGKKGSKGSGKKELNPEAVALMKTHQGGGEGNGSSMPGDVIQDRMMSRYKKILGKLFSARRNISPRARF